MVAHSDIVIPYFNYLGTIHIHPVKEVYRNSGTSYASQYPLTDHISKLSSLPKMSIEITASSTCQTAMMSSNNPGLGTFSILPREIRDEIYRNLVKDNYCFYYAATRPCRWTLRMVSRSRTKKPDLALLLVSKATYDELSSMFYSESVFRFDFDRPHNPIYLPEPIVPRMMKIELLFGCEWWQDYHVRAVKMFKSKGTLRDSLTVTSDFGPPDFGEMWTDVLSKEFEAFKSFRTVILKVNTEKYFSTGPNGEALRKYVTRLIKQG